MKKTHRLIRIILALLTTLLVACGGGGDLKPEPPHSLGGTVSGLSKGVVVIGIKNHGVSVTIENPKSLAIVEFMFQGLLDHDSPYELEIKSTPTNQACEIASGGTGIMGHEDIKNIKVACFDR